MNSRERWVRLKELFSEAFDRELDSDSDALKALCGGDESLYADLRKLLAEHCLLEAERQPAPPRKQIEVDLSAVANGRFRDAFCVGSGGFGDVYKVYDRRRGETVALKILRGSSPSALLRFKNEFRKLGNVRHPNLVGLYELISEEPGWMFTMEYLHGVDFLRYAGIVEGAFVNPLEERERRIRSALPQLAAALTALHERGLLHRDLKPTNVMVANERVCVLDFGLVHNFEDEAGASSTIAGTPEYMSPEQGSGLPLSEASDWYAVGVMVYEALTGSLPFRGTTHQLLQKKQYGPPPPPADLDSGISADLNALCVRLLHPEPAERMAAAGRIGRTAPAPSPARTQAAQPSHKPQLFGRDRELQMLQSAFTRSVEGRPVIAHVHGPSGVGKTMLVREFLSQAKSAYPLTLVFAGRCYQSESVPFQGLDDLVDSMAQHLRHLGQAEISAVLPRNYTLLLRMFPVLGQIRHTELRSALPLDSTELRARAFAALRELLGRLAARHRVILAIDDLQWGDLDTSAFLTEFTQSADAPPLLLILSYRSEDIEVLSWLKHLNALPVEGRSSFTEQRHLNLGCLAPGDTARLATSLAHDSAHRDERVLQAVVEQSGGDPFLVHEIMRWIEDNGTAAAAAGQFHVDTALLSRFEVLAPPERRMLELVAVTGQPLSFEVLQKCIGQPESLAARDRLLSQRLLRSRTAQGRDEMEVYHDRIRAAVLRFLPAGALRLRNQELAAALEETDGADPEMLAVRYQDAGDPVRAATYALAAARRAVRALAFNKAAHFFRFAAENTPTGTPERVPIGRELGDALSNAGRCAEAALAYLEAAAGSTGLERTRLHGHAASQYLRSGYIRQGRALLRDALRQSGIHSPSNRKLQVLCIGALRLRIRLRGLDYQERPESEIIPGDLFRLDLCAAAALGLSMIDPISSAEFSSRATLMALKFGEPYRAALSLAGEATQLGQPGTQEGMVKARQLLERASGIATRINNPHARGFVQLMSGVVSYLEGSWKRCCQECDAATEIFRADCNGISWELSTASTFSFVARCLSGEWSENRRLLPVLLREAGMRGDLYASISLRILGCAYILDLAAGDPDAAERQLERDLAAWPTDQFDLQHANGLLAQIDISQYREQPETGWRHLEEHWGQLKKSGLLLVATTFVFSHCGRGRIALAMARQAALRNQPVEPFLGYARSAARAILRHGPKWSEGLSHLLAAGVASFADPTQAAPLLERSLQLLERYGLTPFRMAAAHRLAHLRARSDSEELFQIVDAWTAHNGIVCPGRIFHGLAPGNWPVE